MIKKIDFYFDFISPYTYLAYKKIQSLPNDIKINYKPILLGGLHKLQGITAPAFINSKLKNMKNDCELIAKKNKFNFKWNSKFPLNSIIIMRGFFCIDSNIKDQYMDAIFNAYWKDNLDISNKEILISLLEKFRIDINSFFEAIKDPITKGKLKNTTMEAHEKNVFGAPTFVVNNKIFWGQDRLNYALDEYNS